MDRPPPAESAIPAQAWARFRRFFKAWSLFTLAVVLGAMGWMAASFGFESIHHTIAMGIGIGLTMELGGALMGLVFASNRSGHDEAVRDYAPDEGDSAG
jgi:hypothetical protein